LPDATGWHASQAVQSCIRQGLGTRVRHAPGVAGCSILHTRYSLIGPG